MEIALFKVNQLGDNVVFLPVVEELRRLAPDLGITLFTSPVAAPLFEGCLPRERIVAVERKAFNGAWHQPLLFASLLRQLQRKAVEASLLSYDQGSMAHLLARLSGGAIRIGSAHIDIRLPHGLTQQVSCGPDMSIAAWNWEMGSSLARSLGIGGWGSTPKAPNLAHLTGPILRSSEKPLVLVHPGASREYQRWPIEFFADTAARLASDVDVQWIDRPELPPHRLDPRIRRISTPTTAYLARRIASAHLFLCNNSGPMHIASALGVPTLVLTGPTLKAWDPSWHRERCEILRRTELPCQPCDRLEGAPNACLNTADPLACLRRWTALDISDRCLAMLRRDGLPARGEVTGQ